MKLRWPALLKRCTDMGSSSVAGKCQLYTGARWAKVRVGHAFFSKESNVLAFFCVLYKRMGHSVRSFAFFIKESGVLCVLLHSV